MKLSFSFSSKNIIPRARAFISLARTVRLALVIIALSLLTALLLDIFIFYRYSYRVVNLNPKPVMQSIAIDRVGIREALKVLDGRAEKFKELYGIGTTTSLLRKPAD